MNAKELAKYIDHTILHTDCTSKEIENFCKEAISLGTYAVALNSCWVEEAAKHLKGSNVIVDAAIGFPLGQANKDGKVAEAKCAVASGCDELDVVMNVGALKSGYYDYVKEEIMEIVKVADKRIVKVIIESGLLNDNEKIKATNLIIESGADFVKTSSGMNNISGATVHDIEILKRTAAGKIKVKASGGMTNLKIVLSMIEAGADRIGTKFTKNIMAELTEN
jgi:deoxyribose-phosphate aldolase